MANEGVLSSWWSRIRGRLEPRPMPIEFAGSTVTPLRALVASPEHVLGAFGVSGGERVLEIGPGIGYYTGEAVRRVGSDGQVVCLDIQSDMLAATRRRLTGAGSAADFVRASALRLPFPAGSFDRVYLVAVLGEFPDRRAGLAEIRRVLCPGGYLGVSEQFPDPDFIFPATLRRDLTAAGFAEQATRGVLWYTSLWRVAA